MSVDVFVFLRKQDLPPVDAWQAQLDALGALVRLDGGVDPRTHTGYWPADLDGATSGFEFFTGSLSATFGPTAPPGIGDRDLVAQFVTHSDMRELKCSMLAAAALAEAGDGVVFDEDTEGTMTGAAFAAQALAIDD